MNKGEIVRRFLISRQNGEVKYLIWTKDNILRAPAFIGLRSDRLHKDCVLEV